MSFNFGAPKTATGFTLPTTSTIATATSTTTPQFSLGTSASTTTTAATSFTPILSTGTSLSSGFSLASSAATSAPLKLTTTLTPSSTTTTSASGLGLGGLTATTQAPAVTTTTAASLPTSGTLTYAQLEDCINKWTIDLEEQGKFFINQTKQLNAWDNLLVSNTDKILALNETIERVKQQQKQLDQELDFVLAQDNELDELSLPLEKQLTDIPVTDQNRFQTYQLSEIIDSQLKQMSEDLKEIVEHLNESNKNEDITDPVIQVSRILNAHMNSLQWIDRNSSQICSHLEQITQLHETYKKNVFIKISSIQ
ncbi:nuclear pore glycoprotein p62 isoform X2 [Tribolium castaneum]|uniref:nuclear pore glycoprotein p62 isoform X2 n=1 Tax=Tribolium castaneum TaxID=7070 RepID=UPI00077DEBC5|nr:PREDICTED: nuclear pore glycoprotein p62 isoform X2 [Tribolium castaneum]|eukprot:XP_015837038.1 PREDICTED: nuclear pore glycoprotein p62 isoform X2 [Tribolium castaneum]